MTIEDLELSLSIPSFEDELAQTDIPRRVIVPRELDENGIPIKSRTKTINGHVATLVSCPRCGVQTWVGPYDIFRCPHTPHDDGEILNDEIEN